MKRAEVCILNCALDELLYFVAHLFEKRADECEYDQGTSVSQADTNHVAPIKLEEDLCGSSRDRIVRWLLALPVSNPFAQRIREFPGDGRQVSFAGR